MKQEVARTIKKEARTQQSYEAFQEQTVIPAGTCLSWKNLQLYEEARQERERNVKAREKLRNLEQTGTVESYITEFKSLLNEISNPELFATNIFLNGLRPAIRELTKKWQPQELEIAMECAQLEEYINTTPPNILKQNLMESESRIPEKENQKSPARVEANSFSKVVDYGCATVLESRFPARTHELCSKVEDQKDALKVKTQKGAVKVEANLLLNLLDNNCELVLEVAASSKDCSINSDDDEPVCVLEEIPNSDLMIKATANSDSISADQSCAAMSNSVDPSGATDPVDSTHCSDDEAFLNVMQNQLMKKLTANSDSVLDQLREQENELHWVTVCETDWGPKQNSAGTALVTNQNCPIAVITDSGLELTDQLHHQVTEQKSKLEGAVTVQANVVTRQNCFGAVELEFTIHLRDNLDFREIVGLLVAVQQHIGIKEEPPPKTSVNAGGVFLLSLRTRIVSKGGDLLRYSASILEAQARWPLGSLEGYK